MSGVVNNIIGRAPISTCVGNLQQIFTCVCPLSMQVVPRRKSNNRIRDEIIEAIVSGARGSCWSRISWRAGQTIEK